MVNSRCVVEVHFHHREEVKQLKMIETGSRAADLRSQLRATLCEVPEDRKGPGRMGAHACTAIKSSKSAAPNLVYDGYLRRDKTEPCGGV